MKIEEFIKLCKNKKPIIKMKGNIYEYAEESFDPEMIGKVIDVYMEDDDSYCLLVDMNGYEKHNKLVAVHNWEDDKGEFTLSWFDTKYYPKNGIEALYVPLNHNVPFEIINPSYLFSNYLKDKSNKTYVEFLEDIILDLRDEIKELRNNY